MPNGHTNGHANGHSNGNGNGNGTASSAPCPPTRPQPSDAPQRRARPLGPHLGRRLRRPGADRRDLDRRRSDQRRRRAQPSSTPAETGAAAPPPTPRAERPAEPIALEALTPGAVAGSATIAPAAEGEGYVLRLEGLPQPDGYYRLWAYDSLIESAPVAGLAAGSGSVAFELPADAGDYESLDLSVEAGPGDSIHSGQSLFRISLADID